MKSNLRVVDSSMVSFGAERRTFADLKGALADKHSMFLTLIPARRLLHELGPKKGRIERPWG